MSLWLREACAALGAGPAVVDDAELCANEAFANLCAHAFPAGGYHAIRLILVAAPGGVQMTIEDDGIEFDPVTAPLPSPPQALANVRSGGYGLVVLRRLARAMRYERVGDRNRLTLVFSTT
jgi:anti-sigma regulatory factor (Ser/Thr protein kinase)